jgi:hypothetical protein
MADKVYKLIANVKKDANGKFVRRKVSGDDLGWDHDYIDVEWTHAGGFKPHEKEKIVRVTDAEVVTRQLAAVAAAAGTISKEQAAALAAVKLPVWAASSEWHMFTIPDATAPAVIKDQIVVSKDTPDSTVLMMLAEKREKLAKALGVAE